MANLDLRVFLDSNVILSGLLSAKGAPRIILDLLSIRVPGIHGLTGAYNLEEIERNLSKKFPGLKSVFQRHLPLMNLEVISLPHFEEIEDLTKKMSPKDAPVLASAWKARAGYLVTGDKKGFPKSVAKPVFVVSPAEFLFLLEEKLRKNEL